MLDERELDSLAHRFETASPQAILTWAWRTFGPTIAATSSFQTQSVPLLYMIAQATPQLPILFLDTGFHFPETLAFRDRLMAEWQLNVQVLKPKVGYEGFRRQYGDLFRSDPDMCCYINKVEPLQEARRHLSGWIAGIRRDQTPQRRHTPIIGRQSNGQFKICPMATWTQRDIWQYISAHDLPIHPLLKDGYMSIGCAPCTRPIGQDEDERAGRWSERNKTECGLHIDLTLKGSNAQEADPEDAGQHQPAEAPYDG